MNWTKSKRCGSQACVEVAAGDAGTTVLIADSKEAGPGQVWLSFTREEWTAFRDGVKAGDFDHI